MKISPEAISFASILLIPLNGFGIPILACSPEIPIHVKIIGLGMIALIDRCAVKQEFSIPTGKT